MKEINVKVNEAALDKMTIKLAEEFCEKYGIEDTNKLQDLLFYVGASCYEDGFRAACRELSEFCKETSEQEED